jgi:hypothetical protein
MQLRLLALALLACVLGAGTALGETDAGDSVIQEIRIDDDGVVVDDDWRREHRGYGGREMRTRVLGEDIVRFGDDVVIEENEIVEGDAVAIMGDVIVKGLVEGDAVAVGGALMIGPRGEIDGDGVAIGGGVTKEPGARVRGETVSIGQDVWGFPRVHPTGRSIFSRVGSLVFLIMWVVVLVLLGLLVVAVGGKQVGFVMERARKETFKMGLIGLLAEVLVVPAALLLAVTIIGIPVAIILVFLILPLSWLFGFIAVSRAVGYRVGNGGGRSVYAAVALGVVLLHMLVVFAKLIGLPGGALGTLGSIIAFVGWAVLYVAGTVGLGAVIMSRFGTKGMEPPPQWPPQPPTGTVPAGPTQPQGPPTGAQPPEPQGSQPPSYPQQ